MPCRCCAAESLDIFSEKAARRELRRYVRNGLRAEDARLIAEWAEDGGLQGATVVEIGGGVGQIQAELLRRGAASGSVVEVVAGYEEPAAALARAVQVAERTSFLLADLLEEPDAVPPADIVVLRRVVCCSPSGPELLAVAAGKARRTLLASYPRDRAAVRAAARAQNLFFALIRKRFRVFIHSPSELQRAAERKGLARQRVFRGAIWETVQFEAARPDDSLTDR